MSDSNLLMATLAAILSFALAGNALLLHREQAANRCRRQQWLVHGARNVLLEQGELPNHALPGYSIDEPFAWSDARSLVAPALVFTCVTAVVAYLLMWSGVFVASFNPHDDTIRTLSLMAFLSQMPETLLYAFIPAYFSANLIIFSAAQRGALGTYSFVYATVVEFLAAVLALILLLLVVAVWTELRSQLLLVDLLFAVKIANIVIGLSPALLIVTNGRRAAYGLRPIEGLDERDRVLLSGHGVTSVQNLAESNPAHLYIASRFDVYRLTDWMGQAQLLVQFPEFVDRRRLSIRTIFDLVTVLQSSARSHLQGLSGILSHNSRNADSPEGDGAALDNALARILQQPSYRALLNFRRIADSAQVKSMESMPAVLSSVLEKSVTDAVTNAMFGRPPVIYHGNLRLVVTRSPSRGTHGKTHDVKVIFYPGSTEETDVTPLDIWEGTKESIVPFRVRFDSDADNFDSEETSVNVPHDGKAEASNRIALPEFGSYRVWATIIQSDRTVQVVETTVSNLANETV